MDALLSFRFSRSHALAAAASVLAVAIFIVDTFTPLGIAGAVFYALVVLMAGRILRRRGILVVSGACILLTIFSYLLQHHPDLSGTALLRALASLCAIGITTLLALENQAAVSALRKQADLLDVTHDAIVVRDMDDVITSWNEGAGRLYGWTRAEAVGRRTHDLLATVFPGSRDDIRARVLETGRWEGDLTHTRKDGSSVIVASRWSVQKDERGSPIAILETNNDITERRQTEEAFRQSEERLRRAQVELAHTTRASTLGELAASIAHEVNQPLAAIVTNGEVNLRLLERPRPDLADIRDGVADMVRDARRAGEVIRRLRTLYRRADPQIKPIDANRAIEDAVYMVQGQLRDSGVRLRLDLEPSLPQIPCDPIQLQQVVINLMVNGVEAMAAAGGGRELVVRSRGRSDHVLVEVQDSGVGLSPEEAERIFDAFYTTKPEGMGMGLSVCRTIVETHGGRLWAEPNDGRGSTFRFTLPLAGVEP